MKCNLKKILIGWYFLHFHFKIQTAKLALRRLKTLRHPNILRYIDGLEVFVVVNFFFQSNFCFPLFLCTLPYISIHKNKGKLKLYWK